MNYLFSVRAVDLNNDGKLDLIVGFNGGIGTMLGNGDGIFTMKQSITTPASATFLAPGDFNGDGFMDVTVATQGSGIYIFTGNGDGTLTQGTGISGNIPSVFAADFNGDGKMDLVYTVTSVGTYLALGNGDGTFISSSLSTPLNANLAVADFNGDGLPDVAAISSGGSAVLYGSLTSPLGTSTASPSTTANTQFIAALDLNGDGVPDLAAVNSTAYVLLSSLAHTSTATLANASPAGSGVHQVDASYPRGQHLRGQRFRNAGPHRANRQQDHHLPAAHDAGRSRHNPDPGRHREQRRRHHVQHHLRNGDSFGIEHHLHHAGYRHHCSQLRRDRELQRCAASFALCHGSVYRHDHHADGDTLHGWLRHHHHTHRDGQQHQRHWDGDLPRHQRRIDRHGCAYQRHCHPFRHQPANWRQQRHGYLSRRRHLRPQHVCACHGHNHRCHHRCRLYQRNAAGRDELHLYRYAQLDARNGGPGLSSIRLPRSAAPAQRKSRK